MANFAGTCTSDNKGLLLLLLPSQDFTVSALSQFLPVCWVTGRAVNLWVDSKSIRFTIHRFSIRFKYDFCKFRAIQFTIKFDLIRLTVPFCIC